MTNTNTALDVCPRCFRIQANVNNPSFLSALRPDQLLRHACFECGYSPVRAGGVTGQDEEIE